MMNKTDAPTLELPRRGAWFGGNRTMWLIVIGLAGAMGAAMPMFVEAMDANPLKLMALPAALVLAMLLFYSRIGLLYVIILFRSCGDQVLDGSRFAIAGSQIGIGGLINGFMILIAAMLVIERPKLFTRDLWLTWAPFLLMLFVGLLRTPDLGSSIKLFLQQMSTFAVFVSAWYATAGLVDFKRCVKLIIASSIIPVSFGFYQLVTGTGFMSPDAGMRVYAFFSHPNVFAFYLVLVTTLTLYALKSTAFTKTFAVRCALVLYMVLMIAVLGATKTRSAWAAAFALFTLYGIFLERRFLVYLGLALIGALFVPGVNERLLEVFLAPTAVSSLTPLNSFEWRQSLWIAALQWMTPVHYLVGYGLESFPFTVTTFFAGANGVSYGAHNDYVQIFFELGLPGVSALLWMYVKPLLVLRDMLRIDRVGGLLIMILVAEYLVVCASDNMLQYLAFNWYVWFMLGTAFAFVRRPAPNPATASSFTASPWPNEQRERYGTANRGHDHHAR